MYTPAHFAITETDALHRIIRTHPLGILVTPTAGGMDANHLPFDFEPTIGPLGLLSAHVARANPLWQEAKDGDEALVIFRAANAYISPNWYPSKHEFHRQVPTWNYQAVHVHGKIKIRDDEKFLRGVVARLTHTNEVRAGSAKPWKMSDSSKEYIDQMLTAIVGIEIEITKVVGKWKLSQNREERDRINAAEELRKRGEQVTSSAMLDAKVSKH